MFTAIHDFWRDRRGRTLRLSAEDLAARMPGFTPVLSRRVTGSINAALASVRSAYGPPEDLPPKARRVLGRLLQDFARGRYHLDVGGSHGIWIIGAYLEAHGTAGVEARITEDLCRSLIDRAEDNAAEAVSLDLGLPSPQRLDSGRPRLAGRWA